MLVEGGVLCTPRETSATVSSEVVVMEGDDDG